jgi:hypothetical protein
LFHSITVLRTRDPNKSFQLKTSTVPVRYCRGLTRTIYILLHRASENVVPQLGIEPGTSCTAGEYSMKRAIRTAIFSCHSGSHLCCYNSPPSHDGGSWLNVIQLRVEYALRSGRMHVAAWELRITSGSPLCRGLTRTIYILLHRASENVVSQPGIEPGTSCTSGGTAVFSCHSGSHLCCYNTIYEFCFTTVANTLLTLFFKKVTRSL